MFVGHFAVGFAAKRVAPRTNLAVLMAAPLFLDILWPFFLAAGIERVEIRPGITAANPLDLEHYPWSHSLVMALVWSALFGGIYYAISRYARGAQVVAAGVFSHWILDVVTHRPDVPIHPGGGPEIGLGLWSSVPGTMVVELGMLVAGVAIYARTTRARGILGHVLLWVLVVLLAGAFIGSFFAAPPTVDAIRNAAFGTLFFLLWCWGIERTRELRA